MLSSGEHLLKSISRLRQDDFFILVLLKLFLLLISLTSGIIFGILSIIFKISNIMSPNYVCAMIISDIVFSISLFPAVTLMILSFLYMMINRIRFLIIRVALYILLPVFSIILFLSYLENHIDVYPRNLFDSDHYGIYYDVKFLKESWSDKGSDIKSCTIRLTSADCYISTNSFFTKLELRGQDEEYILSQKDGKEIRKMISYDEEIELSIDYYKHSKISVKCTYQPVSPTENVYIWLEEELNSNRQTIVLINRPELNGYDDNLFWYVTKNGEFYEVANASYKTWTNFLTFEWSGKFTVTLVTDYNEETGEYTPISNTIEYTVQ